MIDHAAQAIETAALRPRFTLKEVREELFKKRPTLAPYFPEAWDRLLSTGKVVMVHDGEPNLFSFAPGLAGRLRTGAGVPLAEPSVPPTTADKPDARAT